MKMYYEFTINIETHSGEKYELHDFLECGHFPKRDDVIMHRTNGAWFCIDDMGGTPFAISPVEYGQAQRYIPIASIRMCTITNREIDEEYFHDATYFPTVRVGQL